MAPALPNPHAEVPASRHLPSSVWGSQGLGEKIIQPGGLKVLPVHGLQPQLGSPYGLAGFSYAPPFPGPYSKLFPCCSVLFLLQSPIPLPSQVIFPAIGLASKW